MAADSVRALRGHLRLPAHRPAHAAHAVQAPPEPQAVLLHAQGGGLSGRRPSMFALGPRCSYSAFDVLGAPCSISKTLSAYLTIALAHNTYEHENPAHVIQLSTQSNSPSRTHDTHARNVSPRPPASACNLYSRCCTLHSAFCTLRLPSLRRSLALPQTIVIFSSSASAEYRRMSVVVAVCRC